MNDAWQNLIVLATVIAAGGYLARLAWQSVVRRNTAACGGGCPSCPSGQEPAIVEIGSLSSSADAHAAKSDSKPRS